MEQLSRNSKSKKLGGLKYVTIVVLIVIALGAGFLGYQEFFGKSTVPYEIGRQLTFSPLVLGDKTEYQTHSYKYDKENNVMSYIVVLPDGNEVTVTQQTQPPQFVEIKEYKEKFIENLHQQTIVQSSNGAVFITKPKDQDNKQVGIIIDRGLLVFMRAEKDMQDNEWRQLAESLEIQKIVN